MDSRVALFLIAPLGALLFGLLAYQIWGGVLPALIAAIVVVISAFVVNLTIQKRRR